MAASGEFKGASRPVEYYTPVRFIESARIVMGGIDLDPASCTEANERVQAARFYTAEDDGLTLPWGGRVWLNPPWAAAVGRPFLTRLAVEYESGNVAAAIVAYNAYTLLTSRWAQFLYDYPLCFPCGDRTWFHAPGGRLVKPLHSTVFAYLGPDNDAFLGEFGQYGAILGKMSSS